MTGYPIDLHSHTIHSDGSVTATELVAMAAEQGAVALALTDHDTVAGLPEARAAALRAGIELVNGLEISAEYSPGTMHILGYFIDDAAEPLGNRLALLQRAREDRNPQIARRLQAIGIPVDYAEVSAVAGGEMVGRPHFARVMVEKGYASSIQDAFNRFLAKGAPAYVPKQRLSPAESIELIHGAGGAAVLAHPYQLSISEPTEEESLIAELAGIGLDGIEALYSRHTGEQRVRYAGIAARLGLVVTGGSDFHGSYKPDISLVTGTGDLHVPRSLLEPLRARANRVKAGQHEVTPIRRP